MQLPKIKFRISKERSLSKQKISLKKKDLERQDLEPFKKKTESIRPKKIDH